jgi:hypothetical protein
MSTWQEALAGSQGASVGRRPERVASRFGRFLFHHQVIVEIVSAVA